jgi:LDH2 family malate/lactate/ureidoglycolate dehydrogenase
MVMKPDLFVPLDAYRARMDKLVAAVRGARRAEGFDEILMPGEREQRLEEEHRRTGIPIGPIELESLRKIAAKAGVELPRVSPRPYGE